MKRNEVEGGVVSPSSPSHFVSIVNNKRTFACYSNVPVFIGIAVFKEGGLGWVEWVEQKK